MGMKSIEQYILVKHNGDDYNLEYKRRLTIIYCVTKAFFCQCICSSIKFAKDVPEGIQCQLAGCWIFFNFVPGMCVFHCFLSIPPVALYQSFGFLDPQSSQSNSTPCYGMFPACHLSSLLTTFPINFQMLFRLCMSIYAMA